MYNIVSEETKELTREISKYLSKAYSNYSYGIVRISVTEKDNNNAIDMYIKGKSDLEFKKFGRTVVTNGRVLLQAPSANDSSFLRTVEPLLSAKFGKQPTFSYNVVIKHNQDLDNNKFTHPTLEWPLYNNLPDLDKRHQQLLEENRPDRSVNSVSRLDIPYFCESYRENGLQNIGNLNPEQLYLYIQYIWSIMARYDSRKPEHRQELDKLFYDVEKCLAYLCYACGIEPVLRPNEFLIDNIDVRYLLNYFRSVDTKKEVTGKTHTA